MSRFLDLIDQAFQRLPQRFGGTGNNLGHGEAVVVPYNVRSSIPLYSPVRVSDNDNRIATSSTVDDPQIIGVVIGQYAQLANEPERKFVVSAPSNAGLAAVMALGRTPIRVTGTVSRDQYAFQSSSAGLAKGSNSAAGAFGRFLAGGSNTVQAYVFPTSLGGGSGGGSGGVDRLVGVTSNDSTPSYLQSKIVPGIGLSATVQSPGANETLLLSALGSNTLYNPTRLVYWDDCTETSLPTGATSTGQLTYDATRLRRELGGTSASEYIVPNQALNGPLILEVFHENVSGLSAGNFQVEALRSGTELGRGAYQTDGALVAYIDGSARSSSGTGVDVTGNMHRTVIHIDEQKRVGVSIAEVGAGSLEGALSSGEVGEAGARFSYTGTLNAGDNVTFRLTTVSTRKVGIYGVRVYRGAFAAPLGNTLALSSNTPAPIHTGVAGSNSGSTAATSGHDHQAPFAAFAKYFD